VAVSGRETDADSSSARFKAAAADDEEATATATATVSPLASGRSGVARSFSASTLETRTPGV
jgi:hypothetical protein